MTEPTVPGQPHTTDDQTTDTVVGVSFDDPFRAQEFLTAVRRLAAYKRLVLKDAVLISAQADGRTAVHETRDPQPARTALSGAIWSSLIGLLVAGPVGWITGAAVGAGIGAAAAKVIDLGLPDEWIDWFRDATDPHKTTVALLVDDLDNTALVDEVKRFTGARLVYANLDDETLARIYESLGQIPGTAATARPAAAGDPEPPVATAG